MQERECARHSVGVNATTVLSLQQGQWPCHKASAHASTAVLMQQRRYPCHTMPSERRGVTISTSLHTQKGIGSSFSWPHKKRDNSHATHARRRRDAHLAARRVDGAHAVPFSQIHAPLQILKRRRHSDRQRRKSNRRRLLTARSPSFRTITLRCHRSTQDDRRTKRRRVPFRIAQTSGAPTALQHRTGFANPSMPSQPRSTTSSQRAAGITSGEGSHSPLGPT